LFNGSTNGAISLATGSYMFDCMFSLSSMSATSGNAGFSIANGTGTAGAFLMNWSAIDAVAGAIGAWSSGISVTGATPAAMATATTATVLQAMVFGSFEITGAGTIIPSIQLANAALAVVAVGSYFICRRIGDSTTVSMGNNS